jgi:hypothetical protein
MTAAAEDILQHLKTLPHGELREIYAQVGNLLIETPAANASEGERFDSAKAKAALNALDGKFAGEGLTDQLLQERAKDRLREQAQLEAHLTNRPPHHAQP